jgi:hypothetical protein
MKIKKYLRFFWLHVGTWCKIFVNFFFRKVNETWWIRAIFFSHKSFVCVEIIFIRSKNAKSYQPNLAKLSYHQHFQVPLHHKKAKKQKQKLCRVCPIYNQIWPNCLMDDHHPFSLKVFSVQNFAKNERKKK